MNAIKQFESILSGALDNETLERFMSLLNLDDVMFDNIYPEISKGIQDALSSDTIRTQMIEQVKTIPSIDYNEEKEGVQTAIKEIKSDDTLSKNKSQFLCDLIEGITNIYLDVLDNPREIISVKIEKINDKAIIPTYAHNSDAGADVYAAEDIVIQPGETKIIKTGIKVEMPKGYAMFLYPRSGMSAKTKVRLANSVGIIDCLYHEEIGVIFDNIGNEEYQIQKGDRIGQLIILPVPMINWVETKITTDERGGFGSTGK